MLVLGIESGNPCPELLQQLAGRPYSQPPIATRSTRRLVLNGATRGFD